VEDVYYSIHKLNNGKYVYVFYREEKDGRLAMQEIYDRTYKKIRSDYDVVEKGITTYEEIFEWYPNTLPPAGGECKTLHVFMDGGYVVIYYDTPGFVDCLDDPEGKEPPPTVVSRMEYNLDLKEIPPDEYFPYIMEKDLE